MALEFIYVLIAILGVAVGLDWALLRWLRRARHVDAPGPRVKVLGVESPALTWLRYGRAPRYQISTTDWARARTRLAPLAEVGAIAAWALWVGRAYLNSEISVWPGGLDFTLNVQGYFPWTLLTRCGACVFWNGFVNGGVPALVELVAAILHPLFIAAILLWGVLNGVKYMVAAALILAGVAQWWLARVMRLSLVPRLWSAAMAVVGGHLAGRMENGLVEVIFSAASCALVIPIALELALHGRRRSAIVFGVLLGLALLAGQGYMQIGLVLCILPALVVFLFDDAFRLRPVWKEFALGGLIAILIAGALWVPLAHFWPNFAKPDDPGFAAVQPLEYLPLNLVIRDRAFYGLDALIKFPWPALYINYIGWVPVGLALLAFRLIPAEGRRTLVFMALAIVFVYLTAGGVTLKALAPIAPLLRSVRHPSEISSMAVPLLLALAAWGLDLLLKLRWPQLTLTLAPGAALTVSAAWIVLALPLGWAVRSAYDFGQNWLTTYRLPREYFRAIPTLASAEARWVEAPYADWNFATVAFDNGLKVSNTYRPWWWKDRPPPPPSLQATRDPVDAASPNFLGRTEVFNLVAQPDNLYAYVDTGAQRVPCRATALGGNIDVDCQTDAPGILTVHENHWTGWTAARDGFASQLGEGQWLSTAAPAGSHRYTFRYRPWDVPLGLVLTLIGLALAVRLWWGAPSASAQAQPAPG
jgi:hypothetical protein